MRFPRQRGSTSVMITIFIPDNSRTDGGGLTGLTNASTNLRIAYRRELDATFTTYSGANIEQQTTIGTYQAPSTSSKIRFKEIDSTNAPGEYELHFHDSATAFGAGDTSQSVVVNILETSTAVLHIGPNAVLIPLVPWNYQDGVRMGLTALPNFNAGANGGLPVLSVSGTTLGYTVSTVTTLTNAPPDTSGTTILLGRLTSGRATNLDNLDALVSSRLATAGYTAPLSAAGVRSAVGMATANLDAQLTALDVDILNRLPTSGYTAPPTATAIADAVLSRDVSNVEATAPEHSLCYVVLAASEASVSGTTLTVNRTDGVTPFTTKALTATPGAAPVTGIT